MFLPIEPITFTSRKTEKHVCKPQWKVQHAPSDKLYELLIRNKCIFLERSGNNGHHCEESSSKCVFFNQWHQSVFISSSSHSRAKFKQTVEHHVTIFIKALTISLVCVFTQWMLIEMFAQTPFWRTALIVCRRITYISAETAFFSPMVLYTNDSNPQLTTASPFPLF